MMSFVQILVVAFLLFSAVASSTSFATPSAPSGWQLIGPAPTTASVHFHLLLPQSNLDRLNALFHQISDPSHHRYGQFLSTAAIQAIVAPTDQARQQVDGWLAGVAGVECVDYVDSVECESSVEAASAVFEVDLYQFQHVQTGVHRIRTVSPIRIPAAVTDAVEAVWGLHEFIVPHLRVKRQQPTPAASASAAAATVPQTIWQLYSIPPQKAGTNLSTIGLGVAEFAESYGVDDLAIYGNRTGVLSAPVSSDHIVGDNGEGGIGVEASLDIDFIAGVAPSADKSVSYTMH